MKNNKILIWLLTAVLLVFTVVISVVLTDTNVSSLISFEIQSNEAKEEIMCWEDENNDIYVFLPSYAQLSNVWAYKHTENQVKIDGLQIDEKLNCSVFETEHEYELTYKKLFKEHRQNLIFVKSEKVAALHIDTQSASLAYIHDKKDNEEPGVMRLYTADGVLDYCGEIEEINGRGNSTWNYYDKKPYSINLKEQADLLDMGSANKWVLFANANDSSNLRNKMLYDLADEIGLNYSPSSQWVDLYINSQYVGLYLLSERNEVHPQRVDINEDGSFLVSMEALVNLKNQKYPHVVTENEQALRIRYPLVVTEEDSVKIKNAFQSVENAIIADDGIDPVTKKHWTQLIDLDSWARKYLIEEVCANWDACAISQYFYYDSSDESGKIYASPVWDYDNALGNKNMWATPSANTMYGNRPKFKDGYDTPWFYHLYKKEEFYNRVVELYQSEVLPAVEKMLNEELSTYADFISTSDTLNSIRWDTGDDTAFEKAQAIDVFMRERLDFLNKLWLSDTPYYTVTAHQNLYVYYIVFCGEQLSDIPDIPDTNADIFKGWYYEGTDKPFDITKPINSDVQIYAKFEHSPGERIKDTLNVVSVIAFAIIFVCLLFIDFRRKKRGDENAKR